MKYFSVFFLFVIILAAVFMPFFIPYDPHEIDLSKSFMGPSSTHFFGLDENGKDLFIQVVYGSQISLTVTFSVVISSCIIGLILGTLAAYLEGFTEIIIMALADLVLAFPKFLMALALIAILGNSIFHLIFALSFSTWAGFARLVRGEIKHLKKKEFVLQAKSTGAHSVFLIRKTYLAQSFWLNGHS